MRTRGARGGRSAGISVSDRVLNLEGSWSHENNVPLNLIYCKNFGPSPGIVNKRSTILEAFFCFFTLEVCYFPCKLSLLGMLTNQLFFSATDSFQVSIRN